MNRTRYHEEKTMSRGWVAGLLACALWMGAAGCEDGMSVELLDGRAPDGLVPRKILLPRLPLVPLAIPIAKPPAEESFGPNTGWIAWLPTATPVDLFSTTNPCPAPTGDVSNWSYGPMFSPDAAMRALVERNDLRFRTRAEWEAFRKTVWSAGRPDAFMPTGSVGLFCTYQWIGRLPAPDGAEAELPSGGGIQITRDLQMVVGLTPTGISDFSDSVDQHLHDRAFAGFGVVPGLPEGTGRVRVAVLDGAVPRPGCDTCPGIGQDPHGESMGLLIKEIACPGNGVDCPVELGNYLALHLQRDDWGRVVPNETEGGYFGTPGRVAWQIWFSVVDWLVFHPEDKLVINLSIGWEEYADWIATSPFAYAVQSAISFARCRGALVVAAAGNATNGATPLNAGPMAPATWEQRDVAGCPALSGEPMLLSVWGVDGMLEPIAVTREGGRSPLSAYALQVVPDARFRAPDQSVPEFDGPMALTGTSVAAAAVSGAAAYLWTLNDAMTADELANIIVTSGLLHKETVADYYHGGATAAPQVRHLNVCRATKKATALTGAPWAGDCSFVMSGLSWTPAQIAGAPTAFTSVNSAVALDAMFSVPFAQCGGDYTFVTGDSPISNMPCPEVQLYSDATGPWALPQPHYPICPTCGVLGALGYLYLYSGFYTGYSAKVPGRLMSGVIVKPTLRFAIDQIQHMRLVLTSDATAEVLSVDLDDLIAQVYEYNEPVMVEGLDTLLSGFDCDTAQIVLDVLGSDGTQFSMTEQIPCMN